MREHLHSELQTETYVVFVNHGRRYVDCSDGVCELLGYTRTEMLHMAIDDVSYNAPFVEPLFDRYLREGLQNGEYILRHKNGAPILIHYIAWFFSDGCNAAAWTLAEEWEQLYVAALAEPQAVQQKNKANLALRAVERRQLLLAAPQDSAVAQKLNTARTTLSSLLS